jgi:ribosomal protein S18 acetylase RimI-like enzyme
MDFEIRGVRAGEWEKFRELRLAALRDAPDAFGESYDEAAARPDAYWRERTAKGARPESRIFVAQARDGAWIGITRLALVDESTDEEPLPAQVDVLPAAELLSVFVRPQWRGGGDAGVATRLIGETCEWARAEFGAAWAMLDVRDDNGRALGFYRRLGFVDTGIRLPTDDAAGVEIRMVKRLAEADS